MTKLTSNLPNNENITYKPAANCQRLNTILSKSEPMYCDEGEIIIKDGQLSRGIYYIYFGMIKEYKMGSDGKEQIIRLAKTGDFIGYKGLLTNSRSSVSTSVLEYAALSFISKVDFIHLLEQDATIAYYFSQLLSNELVKAENKLVSLAYKPVRGRLAETLLGIEDLCDGKDELGQSSLKISREDLASLIGTAKETVIRLLSEFKSENLVKLDGKKISLLNPNGLRRIDNLYS